MYIPHERFYCFAEQTLKIIASQIQGVVSSVTKSSVYILYEIQPIELTKNVQDDRNSSVEQRIQSFLNVVVFSLNYGSTLEVF